MTDNNEQTSLDVSLKSAIDSTICDMLDIVERARILRNRSMDGEFKQFAVYTENHMLMIAEKWAGFGIHAKEHLERFRSN